MRVLLLLLVLLVTGCGPDRGRCLASHNEVIHVPEHCYMTPLTFGEITIYTWTCDPAYNYTKTVCDRWEFPNGRMEAEDPKAGKDK